MLAPSLEPKDILIGAHEAGASIDFLSKRRNDRLAFKRQTVQLVYTLNDFRDVKRLPSASEYVMYHIDLRRTFACSPGFARSSAQPFDCLELSLKRDLNSTQYRSLNVIFLHRRYPPCASPVGLQSQPG